MVIAAGPKHIRKVMRTAMIDFRLIIEFPCSMDGWGHPVASPIQYVKMLISLDGGLPSFLGKSQHRAPVLF